MEKERKYNKENLTPFPLRLGFLASHNGTDMQGIISAVVDGKLKADINLLISNNANSASISYAEKMKFPNRIINNVRSENPDEDIRNELLKHDVNLVILSGYMKKIGPLTLEAFPNKILNVHPSLLPLHKNLMDLAVHQAVLDSGERKTGVTIHTIDDDYDEGNIVWKSEVAVMVGDTPETLKKRVQIEEVNAFTQTLLGIQKGEIKL